MKACKQCKKPINPQRLTMQFCSAVCRVHHHRKIPPVNFDAPDILEQLQHCILTGDQENARRLYRLYSKWRQEAADALPPRRPGRRKGAGWHRRAR